MLGAALLAGCATGFPPYDSGWVHAGPGVDYRRYTPLTYSDVHVLRVKLGAARLSLSTPEQGQSMAAWARDPEVLAAVNASFFDRQYRPLGPTRSDFKDWPDTVPLEAGATIECSAQGPCRLGAEPNADIIFSGTPLLLQDGQDTSAAGCAHRPAFCQTRHPRTAFGVAADGVTIYLVVAEGRQPPIDGLSILQLSAVLRNLGAQTAVNLDGGGSSAMLVAGQIVSGRPNNEPTLRKISNALLVLRKR